MLGIFFLLAWITILAVLTTTEQQRSRAQLLLPGQVDEEYHGALVRGEHEALVRYYRLALSRKLAPYDEQLIRINLACALNGLKEHEQALEELDRVCLRHLQPHQIALWLNNRAYTLALLGRPEDALDHLRDAEELLAGDDGLGRDMALLACISGTRGIALLRMGDLDRAEKALQLALQLEGEGGAWKFDPDVEANPARTAERWWWLSEVARARGQEAEARLRLERAAAHPFTEYGARARQALRALGLPTTNPVPAELPKPLT
ncbi:MAG: hypothetical protein RMK29_20460 [Myxococcales bacterium]|nr:hypothetical protein [Myxococcota bacterium]MDW8284084.1 hypothetical protein [Myxococcales bacterium]